jgi:hypothetical protein
MKEEAEQRLRETIENALVAMNYRAPTVPNTAERDRAYDAAAARLLAALQADGWSFEPEAAGRDLLPYALRYGLMRYRLKPPRGSALAGYHRAVAASVVGHLGRSKWSIEAPAKLRKAPPGPRHGTAQYMRRPDGAD